MHLRCEQLERPRGCAREDQRQDGRGAKQHLEHVEAQDACGRAMHVSRL